MDVGVRFEADADVYVMGVGVQAGSSFRGRERSYGGGVSTEMCLFGTYSGYQAPPMATLAAPPVPLSAGCAGTTPPCDSSDGRYGCHRHCAAVDRSGSVLLRRRTPYRRWNNAPAVCSFSTLTIWLQNTTFVNKLHPLELDQWALKSPAWGRRVVIVAPSACHAVDHEKHE